MGQLSVNMHLHMSKAILQACAHHPVGAAATAKHIGIAGQAYDAATCSVIVQQFSTKHEHCGPALWHNGAAKRSAIGRGAAGCTTAHSQPCAAALTGQCSDCGKFDTAGQHIDLEAGCEAPSTTIASTTTAPFVSSTAWHATALVWWGGS